MLGLTLLLLQAASPGLGALLTFFINVPEFYLVATLPFFAGGFLYMGGFNLVTPQHRGTSLGTKIGFGLVGFFVIYLLSVVS